MMSVAYSGTFLYQKTASAVRDFFSFPPTTLNVSRNKLCSPEGLLASISRSFPSPFLLIPMSDLPFPKCDVSFHNLYVALFLYHITITIYLSYLLLHLWVPAAASGEYTWVSQFQVWLKAVVVAAPSPLRSRLAEWDRHGISFPMLLLIGDSCAMFTRVKMRPVYTVRQIISGLSRELEESILFPH